MILRQAQDEVRQPPGREPGGQDVLRQAQDEGRLHSSLVEHVRRGAATPFLPGICDCTLWAAKWVEELTGKDPAAPWRGRYATARGYARLLAREPGGLPGVAGRALAAIGAVPIPPEEAEPGDVGIIETVRGPALAIRGPDCAGGGAWLAKTGDGIWRVKAAVLAWRVPSGYQRSDAGIAGSAG